MTGKVEEIVIGSDHAEQTVDRSPWHQCLGAEGPPSPGRRRAWRLESTDWCVESAATKFTGERAVSGAEPPPTTRRSPGRVRLALFGMTE
jgi:hypothetical protein